MNTIEALNKLKQIESEANLFSYEFNGWSVWRVLRTPIYNSLLVRDLSVPRQSRLLSFLRIPFSLFRLLRALLKSDKSKPFIKTFRSSLRLETNDGYKDVFFDQFFSEISGPVISEVINCEGYEGRVKKAKYKPDFQTEIVAIVAFCMSFLLFSRELRKKVESIFLVLSASGCSPYSQKQMYRHVLKIYAESIIYRFILQHLKTSYVLVADAGEYPLLIASKALNIKLYEIQHGVFDSNHPDSIPVGVQADIRSLLLPSKLLCFGDYWKERLLSTLQYSCAEAVGSPMIEMYRSQRDGFLRKNTESIESRTLNFVFSSQGFADYEAIIWLLNFFGGMQVRGGITLYVKLHPQYLPDRLDEIKAMQNVEVIGLEDSRNLWDLLCVSDAHFSISSASHFDSASLGVPSFILPMKESELMDSFVDNNLIIQLKHEAKLKECLSMIELNLYDLVDKRCLYSARDYKYNIKAFLQKLS
jgi:hypothetical protein